MALNQNQLVACGLLLLTSSLLMAGDKTIDGGAGTDTLVINYSGISNLGDFSISESGDYVVFTDSNSNTFSFKNINSLTVGDYAYTDDTSANTYWNSSEGVIYMYLGGNVTLASRSQFESYFVDSSTCYTSNVQVEGSASADTMNLNVKRTGADECISGNFIINLNAGNDIISSGKVKNADSIDLGSGNDSISLMLGADAGGVQTIANADLAKLDGGTGTDTIKYDESANTSGTITLSTAGASNFENIVGSPGAETITGDANANALAGGNYGGSSTIVDTLNGLAGDDLLIASYNTTGLCNDCFNEIPYNNPIANLFSKSNHETFTYSASYYFSSSGNHTFNGGSGNDIILGGKGEETLNGGTGKDYMHGGLGIDTFVIRSGDGGSAISDADAIYDFTDGTDIIGMSGLEYSQLTVEQGTGDYSNHVVVKKTSSGEFLTIIQNTSLSAIDENDFTAI